MVINGEWDKGTVEVGDVVLGHYVGCVRPCLVTGVSKNGQHSDINGYIETLPSARMALRTAKDHNFTDEDWLELIKYIKSKKQG